ncbi:hypothetical protein HK097_004834, partial [Rhizophlyctis rosea]
MTIPTATPSPQDPKSTPAQTLAKTLSTLGFTLPAPTTTQKPSSKYHSQAISTTQKQLPDLSTLLEWAFTLDGNAGAFMHWLILALADDECGRRGVDVLSKEEVVDCRKRLGGGPVSDVGGFGGGDWEQEEEEEEGGDGTWEDVVDCSEEELRGEVAALEDEIAFYENDADLLHSHYTILKQTQSDLQNRVSALKNSDQIVSEELRMAHSGLLRECGKLDDILKTLNDTAGRVIDFDDSNPILNFFQCRTEMETFLREDEKLSRGVGGWFWGEDGQDEEVDSCRETEEIEEELTRLQT